jgi:hypothetical protein
MGLSFHYSGSIAKPELLPELIDEIQDIVQMYNWKYFVFDRKFPENTFGKLDYNQNIYGICFTPPKCETIDISFLSNGRMSSVSHLKFFGKADDQAEQAYLYMLSVKTQYAGVELHQFVIQLFRYLNKKYFTDFKMTDEGSYWETNNLALLQTTFKRYADLINGFASALEYIPIQTGETIETYFERLLKLLHDKKNLEE